MRVERIILENHREVAVLWRHFVNHPPADGDFAFGHRLKSSDHPQQSGLAATRWPEQHDKGAVLDDGIDAMQDLDTAKALNDRTDLDRGHQFLPFRGQNTPLRSDQILLALRFSTRRKSNCRPRNVALSAPGLPSKSMIPLCAGSSKLKAAPRFCCRINGFPARGRS